MIQTRWIFTCVCAVMLSLGCQAKPGIIQEQETGFLITKGAQFAVVLQTPLSSKVNRRGDTFTVTLDADTRFRGETVLKKGARVNGLVKRVDQPRKASEKAALVLLFDQLEGTDGANVPLWASLDTSQERHVISVPGRTGQEAKIVGGTTIAGALIGQASAQGQSEGTYKGLIVGYAVGTGSVILSNRKEVTLPTGTRMMIRLEEDLFIPKRG